MKPPSAKFSITFLFTLLVLISGMLSAAAQVNQTLPITEQSPALTGSATIDVEPQLPTALSPWQMFVDADQVVKLVIVLLSIASLTTWTIAFAKQVELNRTDRQVTRQITKLITAERLADALHFQELQQGVGGSLLDTVRQELTLTPSDFEKTGVQERALSRINRIESAAGRQMAIGTGLLASIGSTSPFVGLFGTVWGIMNAFIGIAESQTTNLAVVAPGIAEALLATALGLVAAIPAVVIYNHFSRRISASRGRVSDFSAILMQLLSRHLDHGQSPGTVSSS